MKTIILIWLQHNAFLIRISSPFKIGAIWLLDLLNWIYDPFKDLTRAVNPKYAELLFVKAKRFENDLLQNFLLYGTIWNYRKPLDGSIDTGDQALHHGIATAYWAIKYSINNDPDDLLAFNNSVTGLYLHQTIHGEAAPRLIRGFRPMTSQEKVLYPIPTSWTAGDQKFFTKDQLIIEDATSNDTASGHLFGIYHAWKYGTLEIKLQCQDLIKGLANELLNNSNSLVNADGSPTMYGALAQGIIADPLRLSLCLATFKAASVITGKSAYEEHYKQLRDLYSRWVIYPKIKLWWWNNDNDSPRAAMQLYILTELETDVKWHGLYVKGLKRVWRVVHKTGNTFVSFLNLAAKSQYNNADHTDIQKGKDRLSEFSFEDKQFDTQKINSTDTTYLSSQGIKLFRWNGHLRSDQPLPLWKLGNQDAFWQRNLNSVDNWIGQLQPTQQFNGVDFLIAYIIGRKLGLISDKE
jgi:hypothetical protein